ncbi:secretory antigen SsaA [Staphylococcus piscifermentans]|uniref:Uncharacterized protein n=1 Tax=Staphylococcus piscifermentans TaxID=70258 RepID=A0A239U8P8_9STAP|nr:CHAP domain-containing protein [Staphylococcus piscifermentans]RTX84681.1 CHAP domain-containing protein [Staphylococcus piscifermentans]GEP84196.1 hypothetical protein SPI02_07810 [Staphylococcus piscifermentans]SNV05788.1 secretory antigen SsaA [Staphylococcus piscifermentans]
MKKLLKIAVLLVIFGGAAFFFYENKNEVAKWIEQLKPDPMRNNTYEKGQCTYYVFDKVKKDGNLISNRWGDAENWAKDAKKDGYVVNHKPAVHALMQTTKGKLGHVAYIEHVNKDGSFDVSEMNYIKPYKVSSRPITAEEAKTYEYIHPKKNPKAKDEKGKTE